MAISIVAVIPNQTIPPKLGDQTISLRILSGIVECVFNGNDTGEVVRDTLTFIVGRVNFPGSFFKPVASCTVSLASFAYDGVVNNALWAVDSAEVSRFLNVDSGSGTADLEIVANLALRGLNGLILRVNYIIFYVPQLP
jgi:hypothetical protein